MKRSEMVKVIQNQIKGFIENTIDQELLARRILGEIEEKGMLPPTSTCYIVDSPRGPKHSAVGRWWDNEDDTPKE